MEMEKKSRIASIDLLRGIIMVIMALDHVRHLWHFDAHLHNPEDIETTTPLLFFTRWITHFCAPVFIFLTGAGAFLYSQKPGSKASWFLFTRGLWLILLEATVFTFGWQFEWNSRVLLLVIWAIGMSMIFLSLMIRLPYLVILITGLALLFLHNLTDDFHPSEGTIMEKIWIVLHQPGKINMTDNFNLFMLYPLLPYFGLICLGYSVGKLYSAGYNSEKRRRILLMAGSLSVAGFVILRFFNLYGDPSTYATQQGFSHSLMKFLRITKYPVSLQFAMITIGPSLIFLAISEKFKGWLSNFFIVFGKVPMFYYILHIYLIHGISWATGGDNRASLTVVYLGWILVIGILYFPCRWYAQYKSSHPEKRWLSYI